jgi:excisionase family DNA binding protein
MGLSSNTTQKLLTTDELAALLRMSKTSIYRFIEKRKIPFYKIGWKILFDQKDVNAYIAKNRIEPII